MNMVSLNGPVLTTVKTFLSTEPYTQGSDIACITKVPCLYLYLK